MTILLKSLKVVNRESVKDAVAYMLRYQLNKWWVPRHMQACMWALGARITESEAADIMEELFCDSLTLAVYEKRLKPLPRYKCKAFFTPQK